MLSNAIRQLWLPGIQSTPAAPRARLADWVSSGQYYFNGVVGPDKVAFILKPGMSLQGLFAGEVSRFATAALETASQIEQHRDLPRSLGWLIIQSYYSAYFAAHALLRTTGTACTQFDGKACSKIDELANALGMLNAPFKAGSYRCKYDVRSGVVEAQKPGNKGVHEDFWRVFCAFTRDSSKTILQSGSLPAQQAQEAASRIDDLTNVLVLQGCNGGNWLSMIRNEVNYRHTFDAWFPDWPKKSYCDGLFQIQKGWRLEPEAMRLADTDDLKRFVRACTFIVALCRSTLSELVKRSPTKNSVLHSTASRFGAR